MARERRMRIASVIGALAISTLFGESSPRGMVLHNSAKTTEYQYPQVARK